MKYADQPLAEGALFLDADTSVVGVVWVAASCTVALIICTIAVVLGGFPIGPVLGMGLAAVAMAVLTVAAAIHNPRHPHPDDDNHDGGQES